MAPEAVFIETPPGAEKAPLVYALVPDNVTDWAVETDVQKGVPVYTIQVQKYLIYQVHHQFQEILVILLQLPALV